METLNKDNKLKSHVLSIIETLENPPLLESYERDMIGDEDEEVTMSGFEYLQDALDTEWILNSDKSLKGARVLVAFGGPNIWINTATNMVEGHWWGDSYSDIYTDNMGFGEAVEEWFNC